MQLFTCPSCATPAYFNNSVCACGAQITFDPDTQALHTGQPFCRNRTAIGCNWVAEASGFCRSCAMTETVPDIAATANIDLWAQTEAAKRWMLANLGRWGWFTDADTGARPVFRLLSEETSTGSTKVTMGHDDGLIIINVTEASETVRVQRRHQMGELYRTMLGHMRHEIAHFLHLRLSADEGFNDRFRALFGDERADYGAALKRHYDSPRTAGSDYITSYATAHPHEDWAETTAHLLHLVDLIDSVAATRLSLPEGPPPGYDAYAETDARPLIATASAAALAINHVNRAMDVPDLYPFVLTPRVIDKLAFVQSVLRPS